MSCLLNVHRVAPALQFWLDPCLGFTTSTLRTNAGNSDSTDAQLRPSDESFNISRSSGRGIYIMADPTSVLGALRQEAQVRQTVALQCPIAESFPLGPNRPCAGS